MLFETPAAGRTSYGRGAVASTVGHFALIVLAVAVARHESADAPSQPVAFPPATMIWVPTDTPAGGGGAGGGNRRPTPRAAASLGRDALTVPVAPAPVPTPSPTPPPSPPEQMLALSAQPLAAGVSELAGVIDPASTADPAATGAGDGRGTDGRQGGPGSGPGAGPGAGGGFGGELGEIGPPGNGVSWPRLVRDVKPAYTADAMRARITGSVGLSCVVDRDGSVRDCRLTRSLDRQHGLDEAAPAAARMWKFVPARRLDQPVPVRDTIDMDYSLR